MCFGFRNSCNAMTFIIFQLIISCEIALAYHYYYFKNDKKMNTTDLTEILGKNIDRLVNDFITTYYIYSIEFKYDNPRGNSRRVFTKNYERSNECSLTNDSTDLNHVYECGQVSRMLIVEGESVVTNISRKGYELKIEKYVGCYRNVLHDLKIANSLEQCEWFCDKTVFYGMNLNSECICVKRLTDLIPVKLDFCNGSCPLRILNPCGGSNYFSVYSKTIFQKNQQLVFPSWECIFSQLNCPKCPEGRKGYRCEIIDCSNNNGNCDDLECNHFNMLGRVLFSLCSCKTGYTVDSKHKCKDINECAVDGNICNKNTSHCKNFPGSFTCACLSGYKQVSPFECEKGFDLEFIYLAVSLGGLIFVCLLLAICGCYHFMKKKPSPKVSSIGTF